MVNKREHKKDVERLREYQRQARNAGLKGTLCQTNPKRVLEMYAQEREEAKKAKTMKKT